MWKEEKDCLNILSLCHFCPVIGLVVAIITTMDDTLIQRHVVPDLQNAIEPQFTTTCPLSHGPHRAIPKVAKEAKISERSNMTGPMAESIPLIHPVLLGYVNQDHLTLANGSLA